MEDHSLKRKREGIQSSGEGRHKASRHSPSPYPFPLGPAFNEHHGAASSNGQQPPARPQRTQSHRPHLEIDYLTRQSTIDLQLLEPTQENIPECISLINQYDSVLERSESLANNLGARPLSSILLQRFERMFDGPPRVVSYPQNTTIGQRPTISWLDVAAVGDNPNSANDWQDAVDGGKGVVQFEAKGCTVQVSWEEWLMIRSGVVQKMMPAQPVAEDEEKELGALDIVEDTVLRVVNLADQVAARGRQLNHRLRGRRTAIQERRAADGHANASNGWTPHNQPATSPQTRQELLHLFTANRGPHGRNPHTPATAHTARKASTDIVPPAATLSQPNQSPHASTAPSGQTRPRRLPPPPAPEGPYKTMMSQRMEILARGARIYPPCDRCRRLSIECTKNLTACTGCTKKHCKCAWREVTEDEMRNGMIVGQGNGVLTGLGAMGEAPRWDEEEDEETASASGGAEVGNEANVTHSDDISHDLSPSGAMSNPGHEGSSGGVDAAIALNGFSASSSS